jgi:Bifunctional DNA primase/polymerase, N-terminal
MAIKKSPGKRSRGKVIKSRKPNTAPKARQRMLEARLAYAARGWWTFPAPATGEKKSLKRKTANNPFNWGATRDPDEIRQEFASIYLRNQNIGIWTGPESGFFVLDSDTAEHGVDGAAALAKQGPLPETLRSRTPSGSIHYFSATPATTSRSSLSATSSVQAAALIARVMAE